STTTATTAAPPAAPAGAAPKPGCPPVPTRAAPDPNRPRYTLTVNVDLPSNIVSGNVKVRFIPDMATDRLVFRLWPNGPTQSGVGWDTDPPTTQFAEASTAPTADFDVSVTTSPPDLGVLASGVPDRPGHWTATAVRDFAMSTGRFAIATAVAHVPDPVAVTVG